MERTAATVRPRSAAAGGPGRTVARLGLGSALAMAVAIPTFSGGGFDASSRSTFVALAGVSLLVAALVDGGAAIGAARSPLALTLAALGVLSIASAAWTVGSSASALRWGLVICGYAAIFIAAATLTVVAGPWPTAVGIAVLAFVEAVLGLNAVASHTLPDAERLLGVWRPGGTFQYPPALSILEVGAIPVLTRAIERAPAPLAAIGAAAAVLTGAVLGLAGNRLALGLAAAVLAVLMFRPSASPSARAAAVASAGLVGIGGLLAPVVLGGRVGPGTPGAGAAGGAEIALIAIGGGLGWLLIRRRRRPVQAWLAGGVCIVALATAVVASAVSGGAREQRALSAASPAHPTRRSDLLHGRGHQWLAAIQTWLDRPGLGAGADAYYVASLRHQRIDQSLFAHDLPLELAAELGVLGLLLGLALYTSTAWTIGRAVHTPQLWLLAPLVVAFLVSNLVDWTWHLAGLGAVWAAAAGTLSRERQR